ncbi:MAG: Mth938-like domain-containing protein [Alphaproteobacteria bacterium]|nr:Mth938-like domain-containing protein [Alphaproteobacteria bacterium]
MDISPIIPGDRNVIESYGPGRFLVSQQQYTSSLLVTPSWISLWNVQSYADITLESLFRVTETKGEIEVLLIGAGERMQPPSSKLHIALREAGISVDVMDTGAACRTYNLLMGDGRRVAAALVALP